MILRSLASNEPYTLISVPIVTAVLLFPVFTGMEFSIVDSKFPIDSVFETIYQSHWFSTALAFLLIVGGAMLSGRVFNKHEFMNIPVFVPSFVYAVIASGLILIQLSIPALLANVFVLFGLNRHLSVFRQPRVFSYYFESAFWYGVAALIFPPLIALLPGMILANLVTRTFNWREFLIPILAFAVPFVYWVSWLYITDRAEIIILFNKAVSFDAVSYFSFLSWYQKTFLFTVLIVIALSLTRFLFPLDRESNKAKSVKNIFFVISLALAASFITAYFLLLKWVLVVLVLPMSFISGYWFSNFKHFPLASFVFYVFCLSALFLSVMSYLF